MSDSGAKENQADGESLAPSARATRGSALTTYAQGQWPAAYEGTPDPSAQVLNDLMHATVSDVQGVELPQAIGSLLGTLAADVIVDRALEGRGLVSEHEIETMIGELVGAVRLRHYGEE